MSGGCALHPERPGIGVCVECRRVVCLECSTQVDGINRCAGCLRKRAAAATVRGGPRSEWSPGHLLLAAASLGVTLGGVHLLVLWFRS